MQTEEKKKKKRGRPPMDVGAVRTVVAHANFTKEEKQKIVAAADEAGMSVSDFIRSKVLRDGVAGRADAQPAVGNNQGGRKMNSKKSFVEYLKAKATTTEELVLAPAHTDPGRNALLLDRAGYDSGEYGEHEDGFEEHPGYCAEAVVLRGVAPEFKEIAGEFEDSCRDAYSIYEYSPGPGLVWKSNADFEWDLERYMEAK